ncbi:MAG TPA: nuclease-related domain-containing protein [Solirubrobacteraceae bacterium]|nr:nuclease-related domain-containing protein [Solirubrobacteraceae bacterium]
MGISVGSIERGPAGGILASIGAELPAQIGTAGGSALREYERRRAAREHRARERAGLIGVWMTRLRGDPLSTLWWKQGGDGEVKVAKRLASLLKDSGVHLLHDRRAPGRVRANIDHIAVGPGGITVIDAKTLSGKVRVESAGGLFAPRRRLLRVDGRNRTHLVYGVRAQAESVRVLLDQSGIVADVRSALCFADASRLPLFARLELEDVLIDGPRRVAKLARRPGPLDDKQVREIVRLLVTSLPAA